MKTYKILNKNKNERSSHTILSKENSRRMKQLSPKDREAYQTMKLRFWNRIRNKASLRADVVTTITNDAMAIWLDVNELRSNKK